MNGAPGPELPDDIHDSETLVRATKARFHVTAQNQLKHQAFRPPPEQSVISVIRQLMGDDFCKNKAVEICRADYAGLSVLIADDARKLGCLVVDYRADFLGHAHIDHQLPPMPPRGQPVPPALLERYDDRCKKLAVLATFHRDPDRAAARWPGPPLHLACRIDEHPASAQG